MKKTKNMILALIMCAFIGILTGCGAVSSSGDTTQDNSQQISEAEEGSQSTEAGEAETIDTTSDSASDDELQAESDGTDTIDGQADAETDIVEGYVYNNNAHFLRKDDKVYFRMPRELDEYQVALWGEYTDRITSPQKIMELSLTDMSLVELEKDYGCGIMGIGGDRLYFKDVEYNNDIECVKLVSMDLADGTYTCNDMGFEDSFVGVTSDGKLTVGQSFRYTDDGRYVTDISVYENASYTSSFELEDVSDIAGLSEDKLFYCDSDNLCQLDLYTGEILNLGDLPEAEYGGSEVDQIEIVDDMVYVGLSFYEGTGHFYSSGYYLSAQIDVEDSLTYETASFDWTEEGGEGYHPFCVQDGQVVVADGIPGTAFADYFEGTIGYYDDNGKRIDVCDGFKTVYDGGDTYMMNVELAELVGDKIFFVWNTNIHEPDEDIGWRTAYRRIRAEYYMADINTGEVVLIAQK